MDRSQLVIVTGIGPVPDDKQRKVYAPGLRLLAISRAVRDAGNRVIMGEAAFSEDIETYRNAELDKNVRMVDSDIERRSLPLDPVRAAKIISFWVKKERPAAIVSNTDVMNLASAMQTPSVPKWMDFNGHPMAERQEIARIHESDEGLLAQWSYVAPALLTGDHFSTCSTPQKYALMGELGAVGRLNRHTSGHDLVSVLPPGPVLHEGKPREERIFRGKDVPEDAFCLLWTGGFNTWVDEETLFKGVEEAMKSSKKLHFVLTGGEIRGHNEVTFRRFKQRVEQSPFRERFHFYGWVPLADLPNFYTESDAAINIDRYTSEGVLGCRNRLFSWMHYDLPALTTPESEITRLLVNRQLAAGFKTGDAGSLSELLVRIIRNPGPYREMAARANKFIHEEYTYEKLLKPLSEWIENPSLAPDKSAGRVIAAESEEWGEIVIPDNSLSKMHMEGVKSASDLSLLREKLSRAEDELKRVHGSRAWRLIRRIKKIFGGQG